MENVTYKVVETDGVNGRSFEKEFVNEADAKVFYTERIAENEKTYEYVSDVASREKWLEDYKIPQSDSFEVQVLKYVDGEMDEDYFECSDEFYNETK
ncbi:hypothetical protein [Flavobacterium psychrotrophum]|uniref:hypothetical protein n=1 Tax=Flavobacterium psychrotrophum TaxID=2294119 RepID=UPI000E3188F6|nr:hypothetical protein [Flavobacterium psychrotrophum]